MHRLSVTPSGNEFQLAVRAEGLMKSCFSGHRLAIHYSKCYSCGAVSYHWSSGGAMSYQWSSGGAMSYQWSSGGAVSYQWSSGGAMSYQWSSGGAMSYQWSSGGAMSYQWSSGGAMSYQWSSGGAMSYQWSSCGGHVLPVVQWCSQHPVVSTPLSALLLPMGTVRFAALMCLPITYHSHHSQLCL